MPLVLLVCYSLFAHLALLKDSAFLALLALFLLLSGILYQPLSKGKRFAFAVLACWFVVISVGAIFGWLTPLLKAPPILFPLLLLGVFAYSLLPGKEAIVTQVGEASRGPLTAGMRRYTLRVTQFWVVIFILIVTFASFSALSPQSGAWSWVMNVFCYPFVGLVFYLEFILRKRLFPDHDHPTFFEYIRIVVSANIGRPKQMQVAEGAIGDSSTHA